VEGIEDIGGEEFQGFGFLHNTKSDSLGELKSCIE